MQNQLHSHPLFTIKSELLPHDERVALTYQRAKLVLQTHSSYYFYLSLMSYVFITSLGLTASDIQFCSDRFWGMMNDPIMSLDIAMFTVLAAHVGLAIGTLSRHLRKRPDLKPLVQRLLRFETVGLYLLTERGHGLDAFNIETTATQTQDGYILHTPREEAAKYVSVYVPG